MAKFLDAAGLETLWAKVKAYANGKARIETGSYNGTGVFGVSNPNTLTFGFAPKFVFVEYFRTHTNNGGYTYNDAYNYALLYAGNNLDIKESSGIYGAPENSKFVTLSGKTLTWSDENGSEKQYNATGYTYNYVAIG